MLYLLFQLAQGTAKLTHAHRHGYNGAILQALAVYYALQADGEIDKIDFLRKLKTHMQKVEGCGRQISQDIS